MQNKRRKTIFAFLLIVGVAGIGYCASWFWWWSLVSSAEKSVAKQQFAIAETKLLDCIPIVRPFGSLDFRYAFSEYLLGSAYVLDQKQSLAEPIFLELEALYQGPNKPMSPDEVDILYGLGTVYISQYQPAKAVSLCKRALTMLDERGETKSPRTANLLNLLGKIHRDQGLTKEAIPYFERALATRRTIYGDNSDEVFATLYDTAFNYYIAGSYDKAAALFNDALTMTPKLGAKQRQLAAVARNGLAATDLQLEKKGEAMKLLTQSINEDSTRFPHADLSYTLGRLGLIFARQGDFAQSERFLKQAVFINETMGQINDPDFRQAKELYLHVMQKTGKIGSS